jgi:hypothetical protein
MVVSTPQVHAFMSIAAPSGNVPAGSLQRSERRVIEHLASLIEATAAQLEASAGDQPPIGLIPECNAALESCLELLRDAGDRDDLVVTARNDLKRFGRILKLVDGADLLFVMRQIRRVLGRIDACGDDLLAACRD